MAVERPDRGLAPASPGVRTLRIYFIKPSQYDDDGYVLAYRWAVIPSNTLTVLAGLNEAYARERPAARVQTVLWDELVDGVIAPRTVESIRALGRADGVEVIVGLAGVQTGQYPRARDLALQFKGSGIPVIIGGFHVTTHEPSRDFLTSVGVTVAIGEAETIWPLLLDDYLEGRLRPSYAVTTGVQAKTGLGDITVPVISNAPLPRIDSRYLARFFNPTLSTVDTSRGCPFTCSYCAVKNVMGRTMRTRDPHAVLEWVREAHDRHDIRSLFIVDDDFFQSPDWEAVLTGLADLRRSGRDVTFMMQTDVEAAAAADRLPGGPETARHRRSRRFVELAAEAGCYAVFIGFESFNPANLAHTSKFQNVAPQDRRKTTGDLDEVRARVKGKYQRVVENWHRAGVAVHAGYMIGLAFDGKGSGKQAAADLTEIGVDVASFFPYTPLPGTEDYVQALKDGDLIDPDFNHWDCLHIINRHPTMSPDEVYREYREAHRAFYTWRRLAWAVTTYYGVPKLSAAARYGMLTQQLYYTYAYRCGWHPMMGGIWRVRDEQVRRQATWDAEARALYGQPVDAAEVPSSLSGFVVRSDPTGSGPAEGSLTQPTPTAGPSARQATALAPSQ